MYKILNYNKNSNKIINYKLYRLLLIILYISFLLVITFLCLNITIGIIVFIIWMILYGILSLIICLLLRKYFNCCAYILDENNREFYKIGIFPHVMKYTPTDEEFIEDNYFANYIYSDIKKYFKLSIIKNFDYSIRELTQDNLKFKFRKSNQLLNLNALIKINDLNYILKQFNNKNFSGEIFKITRIYSYELDKNDNYYIICDIIDNNKNIEYKNIKLTINKLFDENNVIKNYIINNCNSNIM